MPLLQQRQNSAGFIVTYSDKKTVGELSTMSSLSSTSWLHGLCRFKIFVTGRFAQHVLSHLPLSCLRVPNCRAALVESCIYLGFCCASSCVDSFFMASCDHETKTASASSLPVSWRNSLPTANKLRANWGQELSCRKNLRSEVRMSPINEINCSLSVSVSYEPPDIVMFEYGVWFIHPSIKHI